MLASRSRRLCRGLPNNEARLNHMFHFSGGRSRDRTALAEKAAEASERAALRGGNVASDGDGYPREDGGGKHDEGTKEWGDDG